jgi:hypothetical protein
LRVEPDTLGAWRVERGALIFGTWRDEEGAALTLGAACPTASFGRSPACCTAGMKGGGLPLCIVAHVDHVHMAYEGALIVGGLKFAR